MIIKIVKYLLICILVSSCASNGNSQFTHTSTPKNIDKNSRYLFFMHGKIVEKKGLPASSKQYGDYEYRGMLDVFSAEKIHVISEVREFDTDFLDYAFKVTHQVQELLKAGVPASNITVSGYSKGGRITLIVSSLVDDRDINYVVLAGCRSSDIVNLDLNPSGRILSIYDAADDSFESCSEIFAKGKKGLRTKEIVLNTGDGHSVFYQVRDEWTKPMLSWIKTH